MAVLKPDSSALTMYVPVGSDGAVYSPAVVTHERAHEAGAGVGQRHRRAGHDRAGRIGNGSQDGAGHGLPAAGRASAETSPMQTRKTAATRPNDAQARSLIYASGC